MRVPAAAVDDDLWSAIGEPSRRRMLDLLLSGEGLTATGLSNELPITRQAVTKHLGVLERAGLVHGVASGRERRYQVAGLQLSRAVGQLQTVTNDWDARLARIKRIAEAIERSRKD